MDQKMTDRTGKSLLDWLGRAAEKGWLNKNTAGGYRAACQKILEVESDWEDLDVSSIDVESIIHRFINLKGGEYSPRSLETYKSRFRNAIETYLDWASDPAAWKPPTSTSPRRKRDDQMPPARISQDDEQSDAGSLPISSRSTHEDGMIVYPFPLRPNVDVQLTLPRDLRTDEAKRLVAFINALAFEDPQSETG